MSTHVNEGQQTSGDFKIEDTLSQPLTGAFTPLPIYTSSTLAGVPTFTVESFIEHDPDTGGTKTYHPGAGDGLVVFHPSELEDYHLYGAGVTPNSEWPSELSEITLLLHNIVSGGGAAGNAGASVTRLAFGTPLRTTVKPGDGAYFELDLATGELCLNFTDDEGADDATVGGLKVAGDIVNRRMIHRTTTGAGDDPSLWQYNNYLIAVVGTVTLPGSPINGDLLHIKNDAASSQNLTIDTPAAETIDGNATLTLKKNTGASVTLVYDATITDWLIWSIA